MKIGLAKELITPSFPVLLSGFAAQRKAESKYDDIFVKVMVYEKDNLYYGAISYDLVGFDELLMVELQKIMKQMNLNINNFAIAATHTHSAQGGIVESDNGLLKGTEYIFMPTNLALIKQIAEQSASALKHAIDDLQKARVYVCKDVLAGMGSNRNDRKFKGNDDLLAVFIEQVNGKKALIVNFACHPTVLNQDNMKISADFPGALDEFMDKRGYFYSMFLNGSCGDISTRFTRQNSGYEEVNRYGKLLADKIVEMREKAKSVSSVSIAVLQFPLALKLKKADSVEEAERKLNEYTSKVEEAKAKGINGGELRIIESYKEGAAANLIYAKNALGTTSHEIEISLYRINDDIFVGIPGELFSQLSNSIQDDNIHFITYHKGYAGYFADEYAYEQFYYEALSSPFEKGQSEYMMRIIKEKIAQMQF